MTFHLRSIRHKSVGSASPYRHQRGVVLLIALIVLVAMSLAGIAVMRSVDTNVLIAGNLAFRNAATSAGDAGIEAARNWLTVQPAGTLTNDQGPGSGYIANWQDTFNPGTFDWSATGASIFVGNDASGNAVSYVIHRMCAESAKTTDATDCYKIATGSSGSTKGGGAYGSTPLSGSAQPYYRITARVAGPRGTVSFVQAFVY